MRFSGAKLSLFVGFVRSSLGRPIVPVREDNSTSRCKGRGWKELGHLQLCADETRYFDVNYERVFGLALSQDHGWFFRGQTSV